MATALFAARSGVELPEQAAPAPRSSGTAEPAPTTTAAGGDPVLVSKLLEKYGRCPAPAAPPTTPAPTLTFVGAGPCPTCGGAATGCRQVPTPAIACTGAGTWIPPGERAVYRCAAAHEWPPAAPPTTPAPDQRDPGVIENKLPPLNLDVEYVPPRPNPPPTTPAETTEPVDGKCCSCGYIGVEETDCPTRDDGTHCEHWWDGQDEAAPAGTTTDGGANGR